VKPRRGTAAWHFALVIHGPGAITAKGKAVPIYEYIRPKMATCLEYDDTSKRLTKEKNIATEVSGALIPVHKEADDAALLAASKTIIATSEKSDATVEGYKNCFDFAVEAVGRLHTAGYVSSADYAKFKNHHEHEVEKDDGTKKKYHEKVRDVTAAHVLKQIEDEKKEAKKGGKR
jgi:hypothetical protein